LNKEVKLKNKKGKNGLVEKSKKIIYGGIIPPLLVIQEEILIRY